jgi:hypothetical protein
MAARISYFLLPKKKLLKHTARAKLTLASLAIDSLYQQQFSMYILNQGRDPKLELLLALLNTWTKNFIRAYKDFYIIK